jgi:hypothetical protein
MIPGIGGPPSARCRLLRQRDACRRRVLVGKQADALELERVVELDTRGWVLGHDGDDPYRHRLCLGRAHDAPQGLGDDDGPELGIERVRQPQVVDAGWCFMDVAVAEFTKTPTVAEDVERAGVALAFVAWGRGIGAGIVEKNARLIRGTGVVDATELKIGATELVRASAAVVRALASLPSSPPSRV